MRLVPLFLLAPFVGAAFAAHAAQPADSCRASCSAAKMSEDDRATCRLGCNQQSAPPAATPTPPPPQPTAQPQPTPPPAPSQPPPAPVYPAPPAQPAPTSTASCETSCNSEPVDDRSTCRLMCAQQNRPATQLPTNGGFQPSAQQSYYPPAPTYAAQPQPTYNYPPQPQPTPTYAYPPTQPQPQYNYPPQPQPQPQPTYAYPPTQPQPTPTYAYPPSQPPQPTYSYPPTQPTTSKSPQEIATCQSACKDGTSTDRATCRLNCAAQSTVVTPASSYNVVWGAPPPNDAAARAAVIRQSNNVAGPVNPTYPTYPQPQPQPQPTVTPQPAPPPPVAPPPAYDPARVQQCAAAAQSCITACAETIVPCSHSCDQGRMSSTDRATCKLTCDGNADVCSDDCRAREKTCNAAR